MTEQPASASASPSGSPTWPHPPTITTSLAKLGTDPSRALNLVPVNAPCVEGHTVYHAAPHGGRCRTRRVCRCPRNFPNVSGFSRSGPAGPVDRDRPVDTQGAMLTPVRVRDQDLPGGKQLGDHEPWRRVRPRVTRTWGRGACELQGASSSSGWIGTCERHGPPIVSSASDDSRLPRTVYRVHQPARQREPAHPRRGRDHGRVAARVPGGLRRHASRTTWRAVRSSSSRCRSSRSSSRTRSRVSTVRSGATRRSKKRRASCSRWPAGAIVWRRSSSSCSTSSATARCPCSRRRRSRR